MNRSSIKWKVIVMIISAYFNLNCYGKELLLPPCEQIPFVLCGEGRIKNYCHQNCGKLTIENENLWKNHQKSNSSISRTIKFSTTTRLPTSTINFGLTKKSTSFNETSQKHFINSKMIGNHQNVTFAPGVEEDINEFFEPKNHNLSSTTPLRTTPKPKTKICDKVHACVDLAESNRRFLQRCQTSVPPIQASCHGYCRYDVTLPELRSAFVKGICPVGQTRLYLMAASSFKDNTYCCSLTEVLAGRRGICFPFCNPTGPIWPEKKDSLKYLVCLQALEQIMRCHWAGLE